MKAPPPTTTSPALRPRTLMSVGRKQTIVTGGAGFIGRHLVAALNARNEDNLLIVDDAGSDGKWRNLRGLRFDDLVSIADFRTRVREHGLPQTTTVVHLGASTSSLETDADFLIDNNYRYSRELCEACLKSGARFIFASTAATYGAGDLGYFDNEAMLPGLQPLSAYAFSRHMFDQWAQRSGALARIAGLKYFSVYGPHEEHKGPNRSIVSKALDQARSTGRIELFRSHREDCADGEQQRDFVHVNDAVAATLFLYDRPEINGLFNCGTGRARTLLDVAHTVFAGLEREPNISFIDMPEALRGQFQYFTQADMTRLRTAGFDHEFLSLEDGVKEHIHASASGVPALV